MWCFQTGAVDQLDKEVLSNARQSEFYQVFLSRPETLPVTER